MRGYYPQLLVFLQFGIIGIMTIMAVIFHSFSWMGLGILLFGICIGLWAIRHNPRENFHIIPELKEGCCLVTTGIYRYIRHPMYTSVMLMILGVLLFHPTPLNLLLWIILVTVLYLKAHREEHLWMRHDAAYATYREQSRYFIPFIL